MELFTGPEQDAWSYQLNATARMGPSMVCDVFVCRMWKAAGMFGAMADEINCGEWTNYLTYSLNVFDSVSPRPQKCVDADPTLPYCQVLGKYRLGLGPSYNTVPLIPHRGERCPRGQPPHFLKPVGC